MPSINTQPQNQKLELWTHSHSIISILNMGEIRKGAFFFSIKLKGEEHNWLFANLPSPNIRDGWQVNSLKIRIRTRTDDSTGVYFGGIDKIGIKNGEIVLHEFSDMSLRSNNVFETIEKKLPNSTSFQYGLDVSIHVSNKVDSKADPPSIDSLTPTTIDIVGIGIEFTKSISNGTLGNGGISHIL